jgi:hypothetical protein
VQILWGWIEVCTRPAKPNVFNNHIAKRAPSRHDGASMPQNTPAAFQARSCSSVNPSQSR